MTKVKTTGVKERILKAAKELFIANGYTGTSVRDIASASDSNVAHVKYYFQSKANLFEIIFDEAFDILIIEVHLPPTSVRGDDEKWSPTDLFILLTDPLFILSRLTTVPMW